jgi:hypothetical protein
MPFTQADINYMGSGLQGQGFIPSTPAEVKADKGQPDGYAGLDSTGKVPTSQLPYELVSVFLTSTQANSTTTSAVLTGHTFSIPPGKVLTLTGQVICTAAATTTGFAVGIRVSQPNGAGGNAVGSAVIQVAVTNTASASQLYDGTGFDLAANTSSFLQVIGTGTGTGANAASYQLSIRNDGTSGATTVTIEFASEVAASAVTAQPGTGCSGFLG